MSAPLLAALILAVPQVSAAGEDAGNRGDAGRVIVYGATPGGLAAAVTVARRAPDTPVVVVTPYGWVGGMLTNGLTHPDFRAFEALTGFYRDLARRALRHYEHAYGPDSEQAETSLRGTHAEPRVNLEILRGLLATLPNVTVLTRRRLAGVTRVGDRLTAISLEPVADRARGPYGPATGDPLTLAGAYFVDGTYEGDLAAAAGVPFRVGREGRAEYGEPLAPPEPDDQLQGYNFRLTMTTDPANAAPVPAPPGYDREQFLPLLDVLGDGGAERVFCDPFGGVPGGFYKAQSPPLPNDKRDVNDVRGTPVRLSMPEANDAWPTAGPAERGRIYDAHVLHNVGMLHFLQHDPAVPEEFRRDARTWMFCRDEYPTNGHLPEQLYVREGRRIVGEYVFTQRDTLAERDGDARAAFREGAVAVGDYGASSHGTSRRGTRFDGVHVGEFHSRTAPYQVPLGAILPRAADGPANLAVPVACSASHVGFCALRLEPIWAALGEAAGETVALALEGGGEPLHAVPAAAVQGRLHAAGAATTFVSDVAPGDDLFEPVQWWGTAGGLVALDRDPSRRPPREGWRYGKRGRRIAGQYLEAPPGHAFDAGKPLTPFVRAAWTALAAKIAPDAEGLDGAASRGAFVRRAWAGRRR